MVCYAESLFRITNFQLIPSNGLKPSNPFEERTQVVSAFFSAGRYFQLKLSCKSHFLQT